MNYIVSAKFRQSQSDSFAVIHFCALFTQRLRTGDEHGLVLFALFKTLLLVP